jgi:hypothetical protein
MESREGSREGFALPRKPTLHHQCGGPLEKVTGVVDFLSAPAYYAHSVLVGLITSVTTKTTEQ